MRYLATLVWGFLLVHMLSYVTGSMIGISYNFGTASILGIGAVILIVAVTTVIPNPSTEK